jgi:hypothetical protein
MEYVPIVALQRLRNTIDPASLRGTILMVHCANMPSFLGRTIYYSPVDGKNLNRVFPGRSDGTLSERIAEVITREIVGRATHLVDLHGGDGNESLRPYAYWITTGDPKVASESRDLALAFGLDHIVVDDERPKDAATSMYLSNTAITRGKPAITTETGCLAQTDERSITLLIRGRRCPAAPGLRVVGPPALTSPTWLKRNSVPRGHDWALLCDRRAPRPRAAGATGRITDFTPDHRGSAGALRRRDHDVVDTPPISKGEPVAMVSYVRMGQ